VVATRLDYFVLCRMLLVFFVSQAAFFCVVSVCLDYVRPGAVDIIYEVGNIPGIPIQAAAGPHRPVTTRSMSA
jgi:hypothetical protein